MTTLRKLLLIWLALLVLILAGSQLIVTDSKRVHRVLQACEASVRESQPERLMAQIAPDYAYQRMDWATLHQLARAIFRKNEFSSTVLYREKIKIDGDTAEARFSAYVKSGQGSALPDSLSGWRLKLEKRGQRWLITEIEMLTLNGQKVGPLRQMMEEAVSMGGE